MSITTLQVNELADEIVQMPVRIDAKIRSELKIFAIKKGLTLNELLLKYILEGFEKDKNTEE